MIPFSIFKNTFLELDKLIYFPNGINLKITWAPSTKIAYTTNAINSPFTDAAALTENVQINNLKLNIAVETNVLLKTTIINKVKNGSYTVQFPSVQTHFRTVGSNNQTVEYEITTALGLRLQKIYHSLFNNNQSSNTAYDNNNINGVKTSSYQTYLDSNPLQVALIDCNEKQDYYLHKNILRKSVLTNANIYQYNWFHCDDFTGGLKNDEFVDVPQENVVCGLPLVGHKYLWSIACNNPNVNNLPATYVHYTYIITQRELTMSNGLLIVR